MSVNFKTTAELEVALARHFDTRRNIIVPNVSYGLDFNHEIDLLVVSGSGYATEVEIKVSRQDLKRDLQKRVGHGGARIKAVYFAMPSSLATAGLEFVPKWAGILVVTSEGRVFEIVKPKINRDAKPLDDEDIRRAMRGVILRFWNVKEARLGDGTTIQGLRQKMESLSEVSRWQASIYRERDARYGV